MCEVGERSQKQIAETVARKVASVLESVIEKAGEEFLILRQSHHAISNVAGRRNLEFAAQAS